MPKIKFDNRKIGLMMIFLYCTYKKMFIKNAKNF